MPRLRQVLLMALVTVGLTWGCQLVRPTSPRANITGGVGGGTPGGGSTNSGPNSPPSPQLLPFNTALGPLTSQQLQQVGYLVSNNSAALTGNVSGPAQLVSNNAAGLVSNNAASLVSNNSAALVSNNSAAYRIQDLGSNVASGFVYLTTPDERFWLTPDNRLFSTLTDANGNYTLAAPATDSLIVDVLLSGNRRLTAFTSTLGAASGSAVTADVDLASTLATEFLRYKATQWGFTFSQVASDSTAMADFRQIVADTETLLTSLPASGSDLGPIAPSDLQINNVALLRQHYVVAFGTAASHAVSDDWVALLREMEHDWTSPDSKYRSLALTTIDSGIPPGALALGVAVDSQGNIYVSDDTETTTEIRQITPSGAKNVLMVKARVTGTNDALNYVGNLAVDAAGDVIIPDTTNQWIGLLDPAEALQAGAGTVNFLNFSAWTNPELLVDTFDNATDSPQNNPVLDGFSGPCSGGQGNCIGNDDVALDDNPTDPTGYFVDLAENTLWEVPHILTQHETDAFPSSTDGSGNGTGSIPIMLAPARGSSGATSATASVVPDTATASAATLANGLFLNSPSNVTFHRYFSTPYLYVTDDGDDVILEINLQTGAVRKVVGALPPPATWPVSMPQETVPGARTPNCYNPGAEQYVDPGKANLRYPHKVLFDSQNRMLVADSDNQIIRMVSGLYSASPSIVTIAGYSQYECGPNGQPVDVTPPLFASGDGEANNVVIGEVQGMAMDPQGNLILSDARSNRVRKLWLSYLK